MKIENIKQKFESLIEQGKKDFKTHKRTKYSIDSEYNIVYSEAVQLLLEQYKEQTADEINKLFDEKIPNIFDNKECAMTLVEFENIKSENIEIRKKAILFFRNRALRSWSGFYAEIFRRPDTFEKLITALNNETETILTRDLITTVGGAYQRYFEYFKVPDALFPFLYHKKSEVRFQAIRWTQSMKNKERLLILKGIYKTERSKKNKELIEQHIEWC